MEGGRKIAEMSKTWYQLSWKDWPGKELYFKIGVMEGADEGKDLKRRLS